MKDYYQILGLTNEASKEEIKTAYRKLSLKIHPDLNAGDTYFSELFKNINEANEILSDDKKRSEYDAQLKNFNNAPDKSSHDEEIRKAAQELLRKQFEEKKEMERKMRKEEAERQVKEKEERAQYVKKVMEETPVDKKERLKKGFSIPWLTLVFFAVLAYAGYKLYYKPAITMALPSGRDSAIIQPDVAEVNHVVKKKKSKTARLKKDTLEIEQQKLDDEMEKRMQERKAIQKSDTTNP